MEAMERILEVEHNRPVKGILKENFRGVVFIHFWDICQEKKKGVNLQPLLLLFLSSFH